MNLVNLKISLVCIHTGYQPRKGLETGTVKVDPNKFCHLKQLCNSYYQKKERKHLLLGSKTEKLKIAVLSFFKSKNTFTIK